METAKGQGRGGLLSSAWEETGTLPDMQEVLGTKSPRIALTCIGAGPHFVRLDKCQEKSLPSPLTS